MLLVQVDLGGHSVRIQRNLKEVLITFCQNDAIRSSTVQKGSVLDAMVRCHTTKHHWLVSRKELSHQQDQLLLLVCSSTPCGYREFLNFSDVDPFGVEDV